MLRIPVNMWLLLFCLLLVQANLYSQPDSLEEETEFYLYEGKIIRSINFNVLDIAGPSVEETNGRDTSWIGDIGNALHVTTKEWVVRNWILFKEGDHVSATLLSESERLLRGSGPFLDARIRVKSVSETSDSVDVYVITKDRWTLSVLVSYNADKKNSYFGIKDDNLLGMGHRIDAKISHDQDNSIGLGGNILYTAANIMGTYADGSIMIEANKRRQLQGLSFSRPFLSTETEWAGGVDIIFEKNRLDYYSLSKISTTNIYKKNTQDVWLGRSFAVGFGSDYFRYRSKIMTAFRVMNTNFTDRPLVTSTQNKIFERSILFLGSGGLINQRFYKETYVQGFGVTEDIPIGGILVFTGGIEKREFGTRHYYGMDLVHSRRIQDLGYFSGRFAVGAFRNGKRWEQNTITFNLLYHTPLFSSDQINVEKWYLRGFVQSDVTLGYSRFMGEELYLESETGVRGFDKGILRGTKRGTLNLEARIFSPYSLLGFVLGAGVFADFGLISGRGVNLTNNRLYQAYGVGLRTRNESLTKTNFEVSLVYNPLHPASGKGQFSILLKSSIVLGLRNFTLGKPSVIEYGDN